MLDPNLTYIVNSSQADEGLVRLFRSKLEWAWRILDRSKPEGLDVTPIKDGPDIISTKFSGSFVNRLGRTKPVYIYAGLTGHNRPLVKLRIHDFQRGHTTVFQELLRTDGSNNLAPGCSAKDVQAFINLLYGSVYHSADDLDPDEAGDRSIQPTLTNAQHIASALIHASMDHDPNLLDRFFFLDTGKPYGLPRVLYTDTIHDGVEVTSILTDEARQILSQKVPGLLTILKRETSRTLGFQLAPKHAQPFALSPRMTPVEEMKVLAEFPPTDSGYTIPLAE